MSERLASLGIIGSQLKDLLKFLEASQHFGIESFKGGPTIVPLLCRQVLASSDNLFDFFPVWLYKTNKTKSNFSVGGPLSQ